MSSSIPVARILGVEIRVHWSWVVILALSTVSLGSEILPSQNGQLPAAGMWLAAGVTSVLALISVALHELAHVAIARRNGIGAAAVTIQLLGGTYALEARPATPGQQLRLASAGPLVSIALAIVYSAFGLVIFDEGWGGVIGTAAFVLADWNAFVALINLLPGYPLDGASIVRSVIWRYSGREDRATVLTGRLGRMLGYAMIVLAFVIFFRDAFLAVFVGFAGWLLAVGGAAVERREFVRALVAGLRVGDAIEEQLPRVPPQLTLDTFATDLLREPGSAVLVERPDEPLGILGSRQVQRSRRQWATLHAADVMTPIAQVPVVATDAELWPILEQLERSGLDAVAVDARPDPFRFVTRRSAARAVHLRAEQRVEHALAIAKATGTPPTGGRGLRFLGWPRRPIPPAPPMQPMQPPEAMPPTGPDGPTTPTRRIEPSDEPPIWPGASPDEQSSQAPERQAPPPTPPADESDDASTQPDRDGYGDASRRGPGSDEPGA